MSYLQKIENHQEVLGGEDHYDFTKILNGYPVRQIVGIMIKQLERNMVKAKDVQDQAGKPMTDHYSQDLKLLKDISPKLSTWPLL